MKTASQLWQMCTDTHYRRAIEDWANTAVIATAANQLFEKRVGLSHIDECYYDELLLPFDGPIKFATAIRGRASDRLFELGQQEKDHPFVAAVFEYEALLRPLKLTVAVTNAVGLHVMQGLPLSEFIPSDRIRRSVLKEIRSNMFAERDDDVPHAALPPHMWQPLSPAVDAAYRSLIPEIDLSMGLV